nr:hypothetical protein CKG001_10560 [Bdellovibrio sp. CKG001]
MSQMTEASKKRMQIEEDAMVERWRKASYPAALGFKRYGFREGYQAGMQDPDANKELLDECESLLVYIEKFPNEVTDDVQKIAANIMNKIREARGEK